MLVNGRSPPDLRVRQQLGPLRYTKLRRLETIFDHLSMIKGESAIAPVPNHLHLCGVVAGLQLRKVSSRPKRDRDNVSSRIPARAGIHSDEPHVVDFEIGFFLDLSPTGVFYSFPASTKPPGKA